ncbi:MAG: DNA-binding protein WhiA [Lactobacillaceae bacterium]|jgi:DNA-binding protein WhiA|nr:DNA-binding protein WhiA [Lactobacillaceae bacterium]
MSFSSEIKNEVSILPIAMKRDVILAELSAILRLSGIYHLGTKQTVEIQTSNPASARRVYRLIQTAFPQIELQTNIETFAGQRTHRYGVIISDESQKVLDTLKIDPFSPVNVIPMKFYSSAQKQNAILRGAFIASGSISDPKSGNYHFEIYSNNNYLVKQLQTIFEDIIPFKTTSRRDGTVLYIKKSNLIADILDLIGANQSRLKYEKSVSQKANKNEANRLSNVDNVNIDRALSAGSSQVDEIKFIEEHGGLSKLDVKVQTIAQARLENPGASLSDLGEMLEPKMSKSGVKHRLNKIHDLYLEMIS